MSKIYTTGYDDQLIRGVEDPRPWQVTDEIQKYLKSDSAYIDVGCGTCSKTLNFANQVKTFCGVEPSSSMRAKVQQKIQEQSLSNAVILDGKADSLPVEDESFDLLSSILAIHSAKEFNRVLKPGAVAILEKISELDKRDFKIFFGSDENGPRGQFLSIEPGQRIKEVEEEFVSEGFEVLHSQQGGWNSYLTEDGVRKLCQESNMIRGFNSATDADALEKAIESSKTDRGVCMPHNRILLIFRKAI